MAADEAAQMSQAVQDTVAAPEGDLQKPLMLMDEKLLSRLAHTYLFFFFLGAQCVFGLIFFNAGTIYFAQCSWVIAFNIGTTLVARCFWAFNSIDHFMLYLFYSPVSLCLIYFLSTLDLCLHCCLFTFSLGSGLTSE